jgi:hypothetical protein
MLKNRVLQVKMVKNGKEEEPKPNSADDVQTMIAATRVVSRHVQNTIITIGKVVVLYIAADTVRQVAVAKASK